MAFAFKALDDTLIEKYLIYVIETNGAANPSKSTFAGNDTFADLKTSIENHHSGKTLYCYGDVENGSIAIDTQPNKQTTGSGGKQTNNDYTGTFVANHIAIDADNWDAIDALRNKAVTFYVLTTDRLSKLVRPAFLAEIVYDVTFDVRVKNVGDRRVGELNITRFITEPYDFYTYANLTVD